MMDTKEEFKESSFMIISSFVVITAQIYRVHAEREDYCRKEKESTIVLYTGVSSVLPRSHYSKNRHSDIKGLSHRRRRRVVATLRDLGDQ